MPDSIRQGAFALGATKWQVVWRQVLPASIPGMATGSILALSRAVGETAPLIMVGAHHVRRVQPDDLRPVHRAPGADLQLDAAAGSRLPDARRCGAIVLLVIVLSMNAVAIFLRNRYRKQW